MSWDQRGVDERSKLLFRQPSFVEASKRVEVRTAVQFWKCNQVEEHRDCCL